MANQGYEEKLLEVARKLGEIDPKKPYGPTFHNALCRLTVSPCIEAVALRFREGEVEVLLRQRAMNEPSYPGEWHCPGSFFRPGERHDDVLKRLTRGEALGEVVSHEFVTALLWQEERGSVESNIYLVNVASVPAKAMWYPVRNLPQPTVDHHERIIIPVAVMHFCLKSGDDGVQWLLRHGGIWRP